MDTSFVKFILFCVIGNLCSCSSSGNPDDGRIEVPQSDDVPTYKLSHKLDADQESVAATLEESEIQLAAIEQVLPAQALSRLKNIRIWVAPLQADAAIAQYHGSELWLPGNGYNPEKIGDLGMSDARRFVDFSNTHQSWIILHEIAHAWQINYAESGNHISATFEQALASGVYESVGHVDGTLKRAHALTGEYAYFAELTEACFRTNDFFPSDRAQLQNFNAENLFACGRSQGFLDALRVA